MKVTRRKIIGFSLIVFLAVGLANALWPVRPVPLVVSPQTTYFTSPLRADGTVDYIAAYNEKFGKDVELEGNVIRPIIRALGPEAIEPHVRDELLRRLEITLPSDDPYFISLRDHFEAHADDYASLIPKPEKESEARRKEREALEAELGRSVRPPLPTLNEIKKAQLEAARVEPWTRDEHRIIAAWVDANRDCLDTLVAQVESCYSVFVPLVCETAACRIYEAPISVRIDSVQGLNEVLACRAMGLLGEGDIAGASRDALALCRIGRLLTRHANGMQHISGCLCRAAGINVVSCIAKEESLTSEQAIHLLRALDELPAAGSIALTDFLSTRLYMLEAMQVAAVGRRYVGALRVSANPPPITWCDPNDVMRRLNAVCDDLESAASVPNLSERFKASKAAKAKIERFLGRLKDKVGPANRINVVRMMGPAKKSQWANDGTVHLLLSFSLGYPHVMIDVGLQVEVDITRVELALAAYRVDEGVYPAELSALTPKYLPEIPCDRYNGEPLHYVRQNGAYRIWSVGENLIDDGGEKVRS